MMLGSFVDCSKPTARNLRWADIAIDSDNDNDNDGDDMFTGRLGGAPVPV
jgi:hypothetical protein